jgi:acetylornithine deacetylase
MNIATPRREELARSVEQNHDRLIEITQRLVRIPSENTPPFGAERECQLWLAEQLKACGWRADLYQPDEVAGLKAHPLFFAGRDYSGRLNLGTRRRGAGGGRSLLLSGHIDTVPRGTQPWTRDAFGGEVEGNHLYGRGSNDMKCGVATNLFVLEMIAKLGIELDGDLLFETVVDEEFGGCNGTLAGRLRGYNADAVVLSEPTSLRVCPAQRGGRILHITFEAAGGILHNGNFPQGVLPQLTRFLVKVNEFARERRATAPVHELYSMYPDPVPVSVTKVITSPWGTSEPITIPETAQVELYWQTMPGETEANVDGQFFAWVERTVQAEPDVFLRMPRISSPIRWLPGSAIAASEPVVQTLAHCAETALGVKPVVAGIEGPCDLFVFQQGFGIPGVLWGARGGNTHAADEYVEIDSLVAAAKALLLFVVEWCGARGV